MTSAIYSGRSGLSTLLIESMFLGGAMATAPLIENYPGFNNIIGSELANLMKNQVLKTGVEVKEMEKVIKAELNDNVKIVYTDNEKYTCDALIIATGGERRKLGIERENELYGKGVSYCAVCDGPLYKNKKVAVVGGGNCAASAALFLKNISQNVILIHRRNNLRCEGILKKKIEKNEISVFWNSVIKELKGNRKLESIVIENVETQKRTSLEVEGLFIEVGIVPNSKIFSEAGINTNEEGYIIVDDQMGTNIIGVYAAGDVTSGIEQIAVAVGKGTIAYNSAYNYITNLIR
jgi:thioredoxin reductase (NADPH)